jgi:hypothetical protein
LTNPHRLRDDLAAVTLRQRLIDFALATGEGKQLPAAALAALEDDVRQIVLQEYTARGDEIPIREKSGLVRWISPARARDTYPPDFVDKIEDTLSSDPEVFNFVLGELNRLLRPGPRGGAPRIAKQVLDRLSRAEVEFDARALVADCLKYALWDAIHAAMRRKYSAGARRPPRKAARPPVNRDALLLRFPAASLDGAMRECPESLAFCIVRDYSRGGLPRERCTPFEQLPLYCGTVRCALDKIDAEMSVQRVAAVGTRRKDPSMTGIGDGSLAQILECMGCEIVANSIPQYAKRHRASCEIAIQNGAIP